MLETQNSEKKFTVKVTGCDELTVFLLPNGEFKVTAIACSATLNLIRQYQSIEKPIQSWDLPKGDSHSELLLKEMILKIQNRWDFPYQHQEVCHCRVIATEKVDQAVLCGAHHLGTVQKVTSASTACGTCRGDIEKIIQYRLQG